MKCPNDYGILIDVGGKQRFSPVKYIRKKYCTILKYFKKRRISKMVVTHLHADHFSDIGSLGGYEEPKILLRDKKTIKFIDQKIKNSKPDDSKVDTLKRFKKFQEKFKEDVETQPEWGFDGFKSFQIPYKLAEEASSSDEKIINNRSFVSVLEYAGKKILFPGDIEVEGWEKFFENDSRKKLIENINFFIASHHGHKSGFSSKILDYTGKPDLFIVSAKSGDEHIDSSYSQEDNSIGHPVKNEKNTPKMISTRQKHKSIKVTIFETGKTEVEFIDTPDNLNPNQAKLRSRKTAQMTKGWGR